MVSMIGVAAVYSYDSRVPAEAAAGENKCYHECQFYEVFDDETCKKNCYDYHIAPYYKYSSNVPADAVRREQDCLVECDLTIQNYPSERFEDGYCEEMCYAGYIAHYE